MAGIAAAAIANYRIGFLRQIIYNLAFAFIAPLGTNYNY